MKSFPNETCFVCRKHRGDVEVPGGPIYQDDLVFASHSQLTEGENDHYLGHVFLEPIRHVAEIGDLTDAEAIALGLLSRDLAKALMQTEAITHLYSFIFGDHVPHLHIHMIGRYPGAPKEYWGMKVDEWPDAPRGDEVEIMKLVDRLRKYLAGEMV